MADMEFDEFAGTYAGQGRASRMVHLAGAACSVTLILGLGIWGYKLAVRDVTGLPVMRAMEGPMRIAPTNPGGEVADNQGLSVNAVAASGTALSVAETVVLAPRAVDLTSEDVAGLSEAETQTQTMGSTAIVAQDPGLDLVAPETATKSNNDAVALALAEALADDPTSLDAPNNSADAIGLDSDASVGLVPQGEGLARSPRPMMRPVAQAEVQPSTKAVIEVDASTIAVGTRLVQLGAFDDAETARSEWSKLQGRFGELLAAKSMVIQSAQSGGRTFFRLRATGFEGEEDARRFCVALLAENVSCIPVAQR